jgi:hypothetical protein
MNTTEWAMHWSPQWLPNYHASLPLQSDSSPGFNGQVVMASWGHMLVRVGRASQAPMVLDEAHTNPSSV